MQALFRILRNSSSDGEDFTDNMIYAAARVLTTFDFDASGVRSRQVKERIAMSGSRIIEETRYLGSYERELHTTKADASATPALVKAVHRHTLGGIGVYTRKVTASSNGDVVETKLTTVLKDHLGSTSVLYVGTWIGNSFTNPEVERQAFDPWGERKDADTGANFRTTSTSSFRTSVQDYDRGYTGHEQLDETGLIHMNGRIYDPEIGRFLSPDPYVQVPEYSQNFNRYSYVMNNPLNSIDPSGFSWLSKAFKNVSSFIKQNWKAGVSIVVATVLSMATAGLGLAAFASGALVGAGTGAFNVVLYGGNSSDILRGAAIGAVQGGISSGVLHPLETSQFSPQMAAHVAGHGVVGGLSNMAMGGKFADGFYSAAAGAAAGDLGLYGIVGGEGAAGVLGRTAMAGAIGGTVSVIGGGKFANGAYTAAFQHLLNSEYEELPEMVVEAEAPRSESWWNKASVWVHGSLDVIGLVPGFGEIADGINAVIYLAEGNYVDAGLSAAAMIPFAGWGVAGAKAARYAVKYGDEVASAANIAKRRGTFEPGDILPDGRIAGHGPGAGINPELFKKAANKLGFQKTNFRSHGQAVYKNGNRYITPDADGHNGGVWKMADSVKGLGSKKTRMGTYDANLKRIGD